MKPYLALMLAACGSAAPPTVLSSTATSSRPPEVELVAASPEHAVFLASQRDGTVAVVRNVETSAYPSEEERRFDHDFELSEIVWLSQRPPVFRLTRAMQCNGTCYYGVTFEGCTPSARFENAQLAAGPDGAFALHTDSLISVRWRGRELGTAEVASEQESFRH